MPIYAYRCSACGHSKDVLQKLSDPALSTCPACGAEAFAKQVTAAGFQLKGSGWYVTDFRGGNNAGSASSGSGSGSTPAAGGSEGSGGAAPSSSGESSSAAAPAAGCGGSCACH